MQNVVLTMNEIQMALSGAQLKHQIDLPQIAVIGSQSSGKSSVLESIVKEDFLPRGTGIVTRCPLILQLIHDNSCDQKIAKFSHIPKFETSNFSEVCNIIKERTNELAGMNKDIVQDPIFLSIRSDKLPNLTLIDLPGFTKLQTDDQASDISKDIEELVMKYIQKDNTIILAISPANGDIATSDGLAYAKKVDPKRDRTFGVMTKVDIMDKGTDACDYLSGKLYKLKHGYIAVKCRSQADNNDGKTISQALKEEREFFENHHAYSKLADTQGIPMLANKLSQLLQKHIIKQLPKIERLIHQNYAEYAEILEEVGKDDLCETELAAKDYIIRAIDQFKDEFKNVVYKASNQIKDLKNGAYTGGSKIYQLFKHFADKEISLIDPLLVLSDQMILFEMRNCYGLEPGLFIPENACKRLIKSQICSFKKPIEELTVYVLSTLKEVSSGIIR